MSPSAAGRKDWKGSLRQIEEVHHYEVYSLGWCESYKGKDSVVFKGFNDTLGETSMYNLFVKLK